MVQSGQKGVTMIWPLARTARGIGDCLDRIVVFGEPHAISCARIGSSRYHLIVTSVRLRAGLLQLAFAVAVVAAMTITTAITTKKGSVPRLTCRTALRMGAFTPCA
jgi:hypothetical protein